MVRTSVLLNGMDLITTQQAAKILGVTSRQVLKLIAAGRLPSKAVNPRLHLIARADLKLVKKRKRGRPKGKRPEPLERI